MMTRVIVTGTRCGVLQEAVVIADNGKEVTGKVYYQNGSVDKDGTASFVSEVKLQELGMQWWPTGSICQYIAAAREMFDKESPIEMKVLEGKIDYWSENFIPNGNETDTEPK